jgi:hypothetical protein
MVKPRGYLTWDGHYIAIGRELIGRTLLVFATGDNLVIFYRHHLVRQLTLDRSRRYQSRPEPRRRDQNRQQLLRDLASGYAAPTRGQAPGLPPSQPAGDHPGSGSTTAPARRAAITSATLEAEKQPPHDQRGDPATTTTLSAMSCQ